jgi:hypothetical protein
MRTPFNVVHRRDVTVAAASCAFGAHDPNVAESPIVRQPRAHGGAGPVLGAQPRERVRAAEQGEAVATDHIRQGRADGRRSGQIAVDLDGAVRPNLDRRLDPAAEPVGRPQDSRFAGGHGQHDRPAVRATTDACAGRERSGREPAVLRAVHHDRRWRGRDHRHSLAQRESSRNR